MRTRVPARGPALEQAFEFQPKKRFRNGQETHAQLGRYFATGNHLADSYFAPENSLANDDVSFTREVRGPGRAVFHKSPIFKSAGC